MAYTFDENIFSDLHKDAYGVRPSDHEFYYASADRKQEIWDSVVKDLSATLERVREEQDLALHSFQVYIQKAYAWGAPNLKSAVKWILEAKQFDDIDYAYGADYCAFHFNLAYNNPYKKVFAEVCLKAEMR